MHPGETPDQPREDWEPPQLEKELETWVAQIADSDTFRTAPMMRSLLLYLWEHRKEAISEYAIAVEALGRRSDFDQKSDATVRVQVGRLRAKVKEFYEGEGKSLPLRLSIPRGSHQLSYTYASLASPRVSATAQVLKGYSRKMFWGVACAGIALVLVCGSLVVENRRLRAGAQASLPELPRFWQSFLSGGKPTSIVVPTPVHMSWPEQRLLVRDIAITSYSKWSSSPILSELAKRWGPPELSQRYFVVNHTLPAVQLLQYLERHGELAELLASPRLGIDSYRDRNMILMGGPRNTSRFQEFLSKTNFQIVKTSPTLIRNLKPKPDEPEEYRESAESNERVTFPGIIALLPRSSEGTGSLVLIGRHPAALVSMLLSTEGLRDLDKHWKQHGQPEAWEMVIEAEMHGQTVSRVQAVSFRPVL